MPARAVKQGPPVRTWARQAEDRIYEEQAALIRDKCGKDAASSANYGWGVSATPGTHLSVATKVYGQVRMVLTSTVHYPSFEVEHSWRRY